MLVRGQPRSPEGSKLGRVLRPVAGCVDAGCLILIYWQDQQLRNTYHFSALGLINPGSQFFVFVFNEYSFATSIYKNSRRPEQRCAGLLVHNRRIEKQQRCVKERRMFRWRELVKVRKESNCNSYCQVTVGAKGNEFFLASRM